MYNIGIDLGGTNIVASVVDGEYRILGTGKTPTATPRSADEIFDDIAAVCREAMDKAGVTLEQIDSIGLGTPGTVNNDGVIEFANNLGFEHVPAREMIRARLGDVPVFVANDANCAALGEAYAVLLAGSYSLAHAFLCSEFNGTGTVKLCSAAMNNI